MSYHPRAWAAVAAVAIVTACATTSPQAGPVDSGAPVIVPDAPGSPGRTAGPGERVGQTGAPVEADVRFAQSMIPHHRQALEMAALVRERTTNERVRRIADQIALTQGPEIKIMTAWLAEQGRPAPAEHAHGPATDGMASPAELEALGRARGDSFDEEFLRLMIRHHRGALEMARAELDGGQDQRMRLMARDVYTGQSIEIERMGG